MTSPFDDLRRYADDLAAEVSPYTAQRAVTSALSPDVRRPRKALVALVVTGLLGVSNVALAATADQAVPGDALYGVDRGYEKVLDLAGLGGPRVSERMQETGVLVERGRLAEALALVQETLTKVLESDDPQAALAEFEAEVGAQPEVVSQLVSLAQSTARSGADVSEAARALREVLSNRPDHAGPPADSPSSTAPGQTGDQGQGTQGQSQRTTPTNPGGGGNQP